jgi:hypothetical protein
MRCLVLQVPAFQHLIDSHLDLLVADRIFDLEVLCQKVLRLADCYCQAHFLLIMGMHKFEGHQYFDNLPANFISMSSFLFSNLMSIF